MTIFKDLTNTNQEVLKSLPKFGRLLGIDVGTKRIGIALSDASRFIATPKLIINRRSNQKDFSVIENFIKENEIVAIVIGHPIDMDESIIFMTKFCEEFAQNLDLFLGKKLPIFLFEERLTSFEAREINNSKLSRKKNKFVDDIAASLILQHFMDILNLIQETDLS
ncbi:MAG: Holliday junction resolvase RuvX [Rickettsiales bacterium]|nr:Holliday junction resolvase RuvX [Rickettsiales bacterium]